MRLNDIAERINYETPARSQPLKDFKELTPYFKQAHVAFAQALDGTMIFRGIRDRGMADQITMFIDPTQNARRSANTNNLYTLLIDILPSWQNYPKRSRSVICTQDMQRSMSFGAPYVVLPLGNPMIGVAGEYDFWVSFSHMERNYNFGDLSDLNQTVEKLADNILNRDLDMSSPQALVNDLNEITTAWNTRIGQHGYFSRYSELFKINDNLLATLADILDPIKNDIKAAPLQELSSTNQLYMRSELWISAPCILVHAPYWEDIVALYRQSI